MSSFPIPEGALITITNYCNRNFQYLQALFRFKNDHSGDGNDRCQNGLKNGRCFCTLDIDDRDQDCNTNAKDDRCQINIFSCNGIQVHLIEIRKQIAIAGSYIACEENFVSSESNPLSYKNSTYYNRAFFLTPEGEAYFYDKRHLFRMGNETDNFTAGSRRIIISYRGWNILLLVCYDLRFPVWSRNTGNEYDLLIYVANWPVPRRKVWDILLQARALENISYVCGVNRIGKDGNSFSYNGGSAIYSYKGETQIQVPDHEEGTATATLELSALQEFRNKFPAWKDADSFTIVSDSNSQ